MIKLLLLLAIPAYSAWTPTPVEDGKATSNLMEVSQEMNRQDLTDGGSINGDIRGTIVYKSTSTHTGTETFNGPVTFNSAPVFSATALSTPTINAMYSKLLPRLWVTFNSAGVVLDGIGVSSITKEGTGLFWVNYTQPFSNTSYACSCMSEPDGIAYDHCQFDQGKRYVGQGRLSNQYSDIELQDPISISLICFGVQ